MTPKSNNPADLPAIWKERAELLRVYGAEPNACRIWELAADELAAALRAHADETLSLTEAAKVSGYTAGHLGELVKSGKLPNAGRPNAPRIRRADLPIKRSSPARPRDRSQQKTRDAVELAANAIMEVRNNE